MGRGKTGTPHPVTRRLDIDNLTSAEVGRVFSPKTIAELCRRWNPRDYDNPNSTLFSAIHHGSSFILSFIELDDLNYLYKVDENKVNNFVSRLGNSETPPPLIVNLGYKEPIDGTHRSQAALAKGQKKHLAFILVPKQEEFATYGRSPETLHKYVELDENGRPSLSAFALSLR